MARPAKAERPGGKQPVTMARALRSIQSLFSLASMTLRFTHGLPVLLTEYSAWSEEFCTNGQIASAFGLTH
ncbi:hypothetical protein WJ04_16025 [Burkholderia vietnamiensis]|nr:hypothetical protein WJ04_16025 [Burkholderia vietnamiensis]